MLERCYERVREAYSFDGSSLAVSEEASEELSDAAADVSESAGA